MLAGLHGTFGIQPGTAMVSLCLLLFLHALAEPSSRLRKSSCGALIQLDGSHHDWLERRGLRCVLMACIADASSRVFARFYEYFHHDVGGLDGRVDGTRRIMPHDRPLDYHVIAARPVREAEPSRVQTARRPVKPTPDHPWRTRLLSERGHPAAPAGV